MSCYLIKLVNGHKMAIPVSSAEEFRALREDSSHLKNLEQARGGNKRAKSRLIQFNYSCLPNEDGSLKGATQLSASVGMDIDHLQEGEIQTVTEQILAKQEDLGLLMLERSARGQGLHVVFKRHPELNNEENLRWASELLGVEYDKGAKDITRVFYATSNRPEDLLYVSDELFSAEACAEPEVYFLSEGVEAEGNTLPEGGNGNDPEMADGNQTKGKTPGTGETTPRTGKPNPGTDEPSEETAQTYQGIPYPLIIQKWWEMFNNGQEPVKSNRDVLTFELAVNLRHICGFDRDLLDSVIPCYDGFPQMQKMKCIDSALAERRTQMPKRLRDVLAAFRQDQLRASVGSEADMELQNALDNIQEADELFHYESLPKLPQGVKDSVDAAGHKLALPVLIGIAPAIGALATDVKLNVHGKDCGLNILSFIVGEFASGKGQLDHVIAAWMKELQDETDMYIEQEMEWARKTKRMKSGKAPEQPVSPIRLITFNNTVPNIAERLGNAQGHHCFSFTPEADSVAQKWQQAVTDFSVMLRQAYDESRYDREAKSADAVRVHIEKLQWNVLMCGTQDALYRVITNYVDGLLSRISIARTPDNTFSKLDDDPAKLTELQAERILEIAHLLPLLKGNITLPLLEAQGRKWLEVIRLEAIKNHDRVLARQRLRGCVNAMRITCALTLPKVLEQLIKKHGLNGAENRLKKDPELWISLMLKLQNEEMMQLFDVIADYLLDNDLHFFRERLERAYESKNCQVNKGRKRKGKNDTIYERLPLDFTLDQAYKVAYQFKGSQATRDNTSKMLQNWGSQRLVTMTPDNVFHKIVN